MMDPQHANTITLAHNGGCPRRGNGVSWCRCGRGEKANLLEKLGWAVKYTEELTTR